MSKPDSPLRKLRTANKWTLEEASRKWGVSLSYLSEIETGECIPSRKTALKLEKKTGIKATILMGMESAQ